MKTKSALSFFGSDSEVAGELAALLDHCNHVTIPFVGGASILPHLKARAIVANDLHAAAINFYRVLSGHAGEDCRLALIQKCTHTLSHPAELVAAQLELMADQPSFQYMPARQAWAFWAMCWIGRKGKGGTKHMGGMPSVRRTAQGGTNASRLRAAANDLHAWAEHFERCEWECLDFRELIPKVADRPRCGIYCDPPWFGAGENYLHPFVVQDHVDLRNALSRFDYTTVLVRYGDCHEVRQLYDGWHIIEASSRTQSNAVKGELWILNQPPRQDA